MADDSNDGREKDRNAPTVRELRPAGSPGDTVPDIVGQYVPPRPLPELSDHRTIDLKSVRISAEVDPRRAPTERRLVSPPRVARGGATWWLVGGTAVLLGALAWLLFLATSSLETSAPALAPPASISASIGAAKAPRVTASPTQALAAPVPVAATASEPEPSRDRAAPRPDASDAAPAGSKAPAPREPEKKRRDPWVE
jgi:hypothetical protein